MNLIFFPKYTEKGPSSRYRIYQYIPLYIENGFKVIVNPLLDDYYIDCLYNQKSISKFRVLKLYLKRIRQIIKLKKTDVVYIEYEILPYFPPILEWYLSKIKKIKYIVDYDDAIFHNYDTNGNFIIRELFADKIAAVIKWSAHTITGSPYLTNYARQFSNNVTEIPTSIDIKKYVSHTAPKSLKDELIIGWIGSKTTSVNIIDIIPAVRQFSSKYPVKLYLLGFDKTLLNLLEGIDYKFLTWSGQTEVSDIKLFDVGIMPLKNTLFNKGKCGFKLIQYMACGLPTISTPLETNIKINRSHKNLHAQTNEEWNAAFEKMYNDKEYFKLVGAENIQIVENHYSIQSNSEHYVRIIKNFFS